MSWRRLNWVLHRGTEVDDWGSKMKRRCKSIDLVYWRRFCGHVLECGKRNWSAI